jgi:hypothetical protein
MYYFLKIIELTKVRYLICENKKKILALKMEAVGS